MMRPTDPRDFYSDNLSTPLTGEVAPPASVALLAQADAWPVAVAITPYCGTAHIFDGLSSTGLEARYLAAVVAPGAVHGIAALTRTWQGTTGSTDAYHSLWSNDGGTTGNDIIRTPWHYVPKLGLPTATFQLSQYSGQSSIATSGSDIIDAPSGPVDRAIELQTSDAPTIEPLYVSIASGYSLCVVDLVDDLETL